VDGVDVVEAKGKAKVKEARSTRLSHPTCTRRNDPLTQKKEKENQGKKSKKTKRIKEQDS
jgi:hypothetical protein